MAAYAYVTLAAYKAEIGASGQTSQDAKYTRLLHSYSRELERETRRRFYPVVATRHFDHNVDATPNAYALRLDDDLLVITSVATNGGDTTLSASSYAGWPYDGPPFSYVNIDPDNANGDYLYWDSTAFRAHQVTGIWGWHDDWANAWASASVLGAAIADTTSASVTVSDGDAYEVGQLVRVDSEFMLITGISGDTLTVVRGYSGSTAATHDNAAALDVYEPPQDVVDAVFALMAWDEAGKPGPRTITNEFTGTIITSAGAWPPDVIQIVRRLKRPWEG